MGGWANAPLRKPFPSRGFPTIIYESLTPSGVIEATSTKARRLPIFAKVSAGYTKEEPVPRFPSGLEKAGWGYEEELGSTRVLRWAVPQHLRPDDLCHSASGKIRDLQLAGAWYRPRASFVRRLAGVC